MRPGAASWLVIPVLLGTACSALGINFQEPDIRLDHAVVRGIGLAGGNLDLVVKVANPNNFTLEGTRLQLGVDVEGSHLGDVSYDDDFAVQENGETTLTLPLSFNWSGVGSAIRAALNYGELPYKMKGQATLKLPGGLSKVVSFTHEGRAPLTRAGGNIAIPGASQ
ncbi:MAG: LEA type 2 family protein [Gemmatimonadales bacterium]